MIEINLPLTPTHLDKLIQIASFVDSKLPPPKKPICPTNFMLLDVTPENNNSDITPLREQILTYDFADTAAITINMVAETII